MVAIAACALLIAVSTTSASTGYFIASVTKEFGFSRSAFSIFFSFTGLIQIFSMPIIGRKFYDVGAQRFILLGGITCTLSFVLLPFCSSLPAFYLAGALMGVLLPGCGAMASIILINNWFIEKRGLLIGVSASFSGVGGIILSLILPSFIASYGWRWGYWLLGAFMFLFTVPFALFFVKNTPESVGLKPYGAVEDRNPAANGGINREKRGVPYSLALKTPQFAMLYIAIILITLVTTLMTQLPAHFSGLGIDPMQTGILMSIFNGGMVAAKLSIGVLNDRIGTNRTMVIFYSLAAISLVMLSITSFYPLLAIALVFFACGAGTVLVLPPIITGKVFGMRDYAGIWSILSTALSVGTTIGGPFLGIIYDKTGSYNIAFYALTGMVIVGCVMLLYVFNSKMKVEMI